MGTQGNAYGVDTSFIDENTQEIANRVATTIISENTQGFTNEVASQVITGKLQGLAAVGNNEPNVAAAGATKYSGPLNLNNNLVDYPNGAKVPAYEPAAAARADHLNKKAETAPRALISYPNGAVVPTDE